MFNQFLSLSEVQSAFEEKFSVILDRAHDIDAFVAEVGQSFESLAQTVSQVNRIMSYGANSTAMGARAAIGIIADLQDLINSLG